MIKRALLLSAYLQLRGRVKLCFDGLVFLKFESPVLNYLFFIGQSLIYISRTL